MTLRRLLTTIILPLVALLTLAAAPARAQYVAVSAIVADANGTLYNNCTANVSYVPAPGATTTPTIGGGTFQTVLPVVNCDSNARFFITLPDNLQISDGHTIPPSSMWNFAICSATGAYPIRYCFQTSIVITGTTQNISAALTASPAPILPGVGCGNLWSSTVVYPIGCLATYNGLPYTSLVSNNLNHVPATSPSQWQLGGGGGGGGSGGGLWSSSHAYASGDVASYDGNVYVSLTSGNLNNVPNVSPAEWQTNLAPNIRTVSSGALTYTYQYVAPWGGDGNDGLSWGTAKATWDAACEQLFGGLVGTGSFAGQHYCGTGTIYITDSFTFSDHNPGIWACSNHAYGIQLVGNEGDPGYPTTLPCWENTTGPIETIGVGCINSSTDSGTPVCLVNGGGAGDLFHPALWESANSFSTTWRSIQFAGQGRNVVFGVCTDHTEPSMGNCGVANNSFYAISTSPAKTSTTGPGWYLGQNTLWLRVEDWSLSGNESASAVTNDNAAAVQIGSTGGNGSGAINFDHGVLQNGGFIVHGGAGSSVEVSNVETTEGSLEATFWSKDGQGVYNLYNFENSSDCSGSPCYSVRNDGGTVYTSGVVGQTVGSAPITKFGTGVGTILNPLPPVSIANTIGSTSPGTWRAQTDDAAHEFPAIIVPGTTLFPTNINGITVCGTCTLTTGITDPSGGTQAVQIADTNAGGDTIQIPATSDGGVVVGDSFIVGFWARPSVAGNLSGAPFNFFLFGAGDTCSQSTDQFIKVPFTTSSNSWQHYVGICTVSAYGASGSPNLSVVVSSTQTVQLAFLELILQHGVSDDDISEKALHFGSWNSTCAAGALATVTTCVGASSFNPAIPGILGGTTPSPAIHVTQLDIPEGSDPTGISGNSTIAASSSTHCPEVNPNAAGVARIGLVTGVIFPGDALVAADANCHFVDGGAPGGGGSVTSFSAGNLSPLFTTSVATASTTPALSFTISNIAGHTVLGNSGSGSGAIAAVSLSEAMLPATTVFTDIANTFGAHLNDLSAATIKAPTASGFTASASSSFGIDSATGYWHGYQNGNDRLFVFATNLGTSGQVCTSNANGTCTYSASSGFTPQTNGVTNTTTTGINFLNTTGPSGITFANPGTTQETATIGTTTGNGNAVQTCTSTGVRAGDYLGYDATPKCVNITPGIKVNAQTGTTYTVLTTDRGALITQSNASAATWNLAQANSTGFDTNFNFCAQNFGSGGSLTITPTTSTINGAASLLLLPGQSACINSDNTNYLARITRFAAATSGSIGGAIVGAGCDTGTVTISGASTTAHQHATATPNGDPGAGVSWGAYISGTDTVTVKVCSAITVTPTSLTYEVTLE